MAKRRERTTMDIIRDLRSGAVKGERLSPAQRRLCVERLAFEGLTTSEIADIIGRCDRTIRRDLSQIRAENALHPDGGVGAVILGEYRAQVDAAVSRLTKLGRDPGASVADKIEAARAATEVLDAFVERLMGIGFFGGASASPGSVEMAAELVRLAGVVTKEFAADEPIALELRGLVAKVSAGQQAALCRTGG